MWHNQHATANEFSRSLRYLFNKAISATTFVSWCLIVSVLLRKKNLGKSDNFCSQFMLTRLYKIFAIHKNTAVWIYSLRNLWETAVKSHGCYNLCVFVDLNFFLLKFFYRENLLRELFAEIHKTSFLPLFPFPSFWTDRTFYANKKNRNKEFANEPKQHGNDNWIRLLLLYLALE